MTTDLSAALARPVSMQVAAASSSLARIHGKVVSINPKDGTILVHHDPFHGMPMAMTMPLKPNNGADLKRLHAGEFIDATVDTSIEPWPTSNIRPAAKPVHR